VRQNLGQTQAAPTPQPCRRAGTSPTRNFLDKSQTKPNTQSNATRSTTLQVYCVIEPITQTRAVSNAAGFYQPAFDHPAPGNQRAVKSQTTGAEERTNTMAPDHELIFVLRRDLALCVIGAIGPQPVISGHNVFAR